MSTERIVGLLVVLVMFAIAIVGYRRRASTEATDNHGPWTLFLYPEKGDEGAIIYPDLYRTLQGCRAAPCLTLCSRMMCRTTSVAWAASGLGRTCSMTAPRDAASGAVVPKANSATGDHFPQGKATPARSPSLRW